MENNNAKNIDEIFKELVARQNKNIPTNKRLQLRDIKRIARRVKGSIYDLNNCAIWDGYITNVNNAIKGTYVNFYFRKKKVALHRLLFINFNDDLSDDEYLTFNCDKKGQCCNVYHMNKRKYNVNNNETDEQNELTEQNGNLNDTKKTKVKTKMKTKTMKGKRTDDLSLSSSELVLTFD